MHSCLSVSTLQKCDYLPIVSSYTNCAALFYRYVGGHYISDSAGDRKYHYFCDKSPIRCAILLIPILGNLLVGIYDLITYLSWVENSPAENLLEVTKEKKMLHYLEDSIIAPENLEEKIAEGDFSDNREVMLKAVQRNFLIFPKASPRLRDDFEIAQHAVRWGDNFQYLSDRLKKVDQILFIAATTSQGFKTLQWFPDEARADKKWVGLAIEREEENIQYASLDLQVDREFLQQHLSQGLLDTLHSMGSPLFADQEFVLNAIRRNYSVILSESLRDDNEFWNKYMELLKINLSPEIRNHLSQLSDRLQKDPSFIKKIVEIDGFLLQFASSELKRNKEIVKAALESNTQAIEFADPQFARENLEELVLYAAREASLIIDRKKRKDEFTTLLRSIPKYTPRYLRRNVLKIFRESNLKLQ